MPYILFVARYILATLTYCLISAPSLQPLPVVQVPFVTITESLSGTDVVASLSVSTVNGIVTVLFALLSDVHVSLPTTIKRHFPFPDKLYNLLHPVA